MLNNLSTILSTSDEKLRHAPDSNDNNTLSECYCKLYVL